MSLIKKSVLRIRVPFWPMDAGSGMGKNQDPDPGWTPRIISCFRELRNHFFGVKILKFFDTDPGWKKNQILYPGCQKFRSGINVPDPQYWKKLTRQGTLRRFFLSICGTFPSYDSIHRPPPPPQHKCIRVYSILIHTGKGGGRLTREKVRGIMLHEAGRKYQHDWLYLQSINSINHQ